MSGFIFDFCLIYTCILLLGGLAYGINRIFKIDKILIELFIVGDDYDE